MEPKPSPISITVQPGGSVALHFAEPLTYERAPVPPGPDIDTLTAQLCRALGRVDRITALGRVDRLTWEEALGAVRELVRADLAGQKLDFESTWAAVYKMGHVTLYGWLDVVTLGEQPLFRVRQPVVPGDAGHEGLPESVELFAPAALYGYNPISYVDVIAGRESQRPWKRPEPTAPGNEPDPAPDPDDDTPF